MSVRGVIIAATALLLGVSASHAATSQQIKENKRVASLFEHALLYGDYDKIAPYISPEFKTHDFHIKSGDLPGLKAHFEERAQRAAGFKLEVVAERQFADGEYVIDHYITAVSGGTDAGQHAVIEILRFANGKIVEEWHVNERLPSANDKGNF